MLLHDNNWILYRILRRDEIVGYTSPVPEDYDSLVQTRLDISLYNIVSAILGALFKQYEHYSSFKYNNSENTIYKIIK